MPSRPQVQYVLPELPPWVRNLILALFGLYVLELVLHNLGVPLYSLLGWVSFGGGFAAWQPVTRFLVQGAHRAAVIDVMIGLVVLYFFLPAVLRVADRKMLGTAVLAGAVGGTALPLLIDGIGLLSPSMLLGWTALVMTLPVLYGLARPDEEILLLVLPIKARWFVWGALILALLFLLVERTLDTVEGLGVWLGVVGWYQLLGPGGRRRQLKAQARGIERELSRFEVIEGGRQGSQDPQDDEWIH